MTVDDVINFVIDVFEGGEKYTDAPGDRGGATKFGVTRPFLARALKRPVSKDDIKNLTRVGALNAYKEVLLRQARLHMIVDAFPKDWELFFAVYDFSVNAGEDDGIPSMQRAVGADADGIIGSNTITAIGSAMSVAGSVALAHRVLMTRQQFHIDQSYRPMQQQWLRGWMRRCTVVGARTAGSPKTFARDLPLARAVTWEPGMEIPAPDFGYFSNAHDRVTFERRRRQRRSHGNTSRSRTRGT